MDDNNKKNTSGNTEDIFAIMEKYRAEQKKTPSHDNAPKAADAQKVQKASPQTPPRHDGAKPAAQSAPSPKPQTARSSASSAQAQQKQPTPKRTPKKATLSDRIKALFDGFSKPKKSAKAPSGNNSTSKHAPRPKEAPQTRAEAKINSEALKNHFSDNATVLSEESIASSDTSMNISAHLADVAPAALTEAAIDSAPEKSGSNKVVDVLKKIWYVLTNLSFLAKAVIYVAVVCIISAYVSYYVITIANDVFAFVKTDREIKVNVPENATDKEIAYLLEKNGIIKYDWMFELYLIYKMDGDTPTSYIPGEKTLNSTMNYNQLIAVLTTEPFVNEQISVTIPEGFTVDEIIDLLVEKGIGTREGYVEAINNYPYKHEFVVQLDTNGYPESRKYRLEGYLYPDTYFFYKSSAEYTVINKMLNNFNDKFWRHIEVFRKDIEKHNMSVDDIVTLASMIQAEAKLFIDFESVSYVFHNRLTHSGTFPYLQSDATIQYVLDEHVEDFTQEQLDLDNPYNTYKYIGLPPGAICNPGYDALSAAIYPDAPIDSNGNTVNAYYFVSNKAGKTYYAETRAQHDRNKLTVKKDNEEYEN